MMLLLLFMSTDNDASILLHQVLEKRSWQVQMNRPEILNVPLHFLFMFCLFPHLPKYLTILKHY